MHHDIKPCQFEGPTFIDTFMSFLFTETKKDDTFGQDDKDWDVYKEIVSCSYKPR